MNLGVGKQAGWGIKQQNYGCTCIGTLMTS